MFPMSDTEARQFLLAHVSDDNLLRHSYAVEAGMRALARSLGQPEDLWALAGLLHDVDYQEHPQAHPALGVQWLREKGFPEELVHAVAAHASLPGTSKETALDWALAGVDELTGLIVATALVKPHKSLAEVEPSSVRKKMKDKAFAKAVSRETIGESAQALGLDLEQFIRTVLEGMRGIHEVLGL